VVPDAPPAPEVALVPLAVVGESVPEEHAAPHVEVTAINEISARLCKFQYRIFAPSFVHHRQASRSAMAEHENTLERETMTFENTESK